jgi:hypothetical protein
MGQQHALKPRPSLFNNKTVVLLTIRSELNGRLLAVKFGEKRGYKPLNKDAPPNDPTNIGELLECAGSPELSAILGEAVMCQWRGDGKTAGQLYTHGFHPYLALMEPRAAALLLSTIPEGGAVLDPFCGSGACVLQVCSRQLIISILFCHLVVGKSLHSPSRSAHTKHSYFILLP